MTSSLFSVAWGFCRQASCQVSISGNTRRRRISKIGRLQNNARGRLRWPKPTEALARPKRRERDDTSPLKGYELLVFRRKGKDSICLTPRAVLASTDPQRDREECPTPARISASPDPEGEPHGRLTLVEISISLDPMGELGDGRKRNGSTLWLAPCLGRRAWVMYRHVHSQMSHGPPTADGTVDA